MITKSAIKVLPTSTIRLLRGRKMFPQNTTRNKNLTISISTLFISILLIVLDNLPIGLSHDQVIEHVSREYLLQQPVRAYSQQRQAHFQEPLEADTNQKVAMGRSVKFRCAVNDIGEHKVAWFHKDKRLLLAFDNRTVAWRERIQVSSQANSVFFLQIDNVQLSDKGQLLCQLNTQPPQSQVHILDVVQSPRIREEETTVNIEPVKEFSSIELRCNADGVPKPLIKWRRESQTHLMPPDYDDSTIDPNELATDDSSSGDNSWSGRHKRAPAASQQAANMNGGELLASLRQRRHLNQTRAGSNLQTVDEPKAASSSTQTNNMSIQIHPSTNQNNNNNNNHNDNNKQNFLAEGPILRFDRVSRLDMGFYMCIASNGVPPSVSQRIFLPVSFTPRTTTTSSSTTTTTTTTTSTTTGKPTLTVRSGKNLDTEAARAPAKDAVSSAAAAASVTAIAAAASASLQPKRNSSNRSYSSGTNINNRHHWHRSDMTTGGNSSKRRLNGGQQHNGHRHFNKSTRSSSATTSVTASSSSSSTLSSVTASSAIWLGIVVMWFFLFSCRTSG